MYRKKITYTNFNDEVVEKEYYFNLTPAEVMEMDLSEEGGLEARIKKIVNERDTTKIYPILKSIVLMSYGVRSLDGDRFEKSEAMSEAFSHTNAFSDLMMSFFEDVQNAVDFMNGISPKSGKSYDKTTSATPGVTNKPTLVQ